MTLGLWLLPLPPWLSFVPPAVIWAATTLIASLALALVLQFVLLRLVKALARRTEGEFEDVLIDITRGPLVLAIVLAGFWLSMRALETGWPWIQTATRWVGAGLIAVGAYWLWRLFKEVILHYGERHARRSETRLDDVLLPIANQFVPLLLVLLAGAAMLQSLGVQVSALLVAIGGAAFIMAFALQDILSNVFSGIMLLVDTPFRYGDLILLEESRMCQVIKIGVRVTQLYDIGTHSLVYMPNSKLANERLVNLMQPTAESISVVRLELSGSTDVETTRALLLDVLNGHPDVLGDNTPKLESMGRFGLLGAGKRQNGGQRPEAEKSLDRTVLQIGEELRQFAAEVSQMEAKGFDRQERALLRQAMHAFDRQVGGDDSVDDGLDAWKGTPEAYLDGFVTQLPETSLAARAWAWVRLWAQDPDLEPGVDDEKLARRWAGKVLSLLRRFQDLRRRVENPDRLETRLDDAILNLRRWLLEEFKQPVPPWKMASASYKGYQAGAQMFSLFFFVDNIELEHFYRQSRVEGEIRREVTRRLREAGIEFGSLRQEVSLRPAGAFGAWPEAS